MYRITIPPRMYGLKLRTLGYVSTLPKGTKITVLSRENGKIKSEIKTREQIIKEIKKELKIR